MYTVFRAGRVQGNKKYATYEAARQAVRKWIRRSVPVDKGVTADSTNFEGVLFWTSNPMIGDFGYSIKRVD